MNDNAVNVKPEMEDIFKLPAIHVNCFTAMVAPNGNCKIVFGEITPEQKMIPRGAVNAYISDLQNLKKVIENLEKQYKEVKSMQKNEPHQDFLNKLRQQTQQLKEQPETSVELDEDDEDQE